MSPKECWAMAAREHQANYGAVLAAVLRVLCHCGGMVLSLWAAATFFHGSEKAVCSLFTLFAVSFELLWGLWGRCPTKPAGARRWWFVATVVGLMISGGILLAEALHHAQ